MKTIITTELNKLINPLTSNTFEQDNVVKHVGYDEESSLAVISVEFPPLSNDQKESIKRSIAKVVKIDLKINGIKLNFEEKKVKRNKNIKYIGIASGKGGVGKSTVTANIAMALTRLGKQVAIIDADIYGSSIPNIFDIHNAEIRGTEDNKLIPQRYNDKLEIISTEFFMDPGSPIMWRGPKLASLINHFFNDILWDDKLEYVLIDLPPGTGDVALDVNSHCPDINIVIVTTPHVSASHVAAKAGLAAEALKQRVIGVIENMSYLNVEGKRYNVFGEGGGKSVADKLNTNVIAEIPLGQPDKEHHSIFSLNDEIGSIYIGIANKLLKMPL